MAFYPYFYISRLHPTGNLQPTLNSIANQSIVMDAAVQTISLAGITDGGDTGQTLTVTASSSNTAIIPAPTVHYTSAASTGTVTYLPTAASPAGTTGTALAKVTVNDGTRTITRDFTVTVTDDATAADTFAGEDGDEVNGREMTLGERGWADSDDVWEIRSNKLRLVASAFAGATTRYLIAEQLIGNGSQSLDVTTVTNDTLNVGLIGRHTAGSHEGYLALLYGNAGTYTALLAKMEDDGDGGIAVVDISSGGAALTVTPGQTLRFRYTMNGTSHKVHVDGVQKISVTDASYDTSVTGGGIYVGCNDALSDTHIFDNYRVTGTLTAPSASVIVTFDSLTATTTVPYAHRASIDFDHSMDGTASVLPERIAYTDLALVFVSAIGLNVVYDGYTLSPSLQGQEWDVGDLGLNFWNVDSGQPNFFYAGRNTDNWQLLDQITWESILSGRSGQLRLWYN